MENVTVDSIRGQLRDDIVYISLFGTMHCMEGNKEEKLAALMSADNLARFGVNCGLITKEEWQDWCGAIHNNEPAIADVLAKWNPEPETTDQCTPTT